MNIFKLVKQQLFGAAVIVAILITTEVYSQDQINEKISVDSLSKVLETNSKITLLDIRTPKEIEEGYIRGVKFHDFRSDDFIESIEHLQRESTYILICKAGIRASQAQKLMKQMSFQHVFVLEGGMDAWEKAGKQVIK